MKVSELITGNIPSVKGEKYNMLSKFEIWTTNEEKELLKKLKDPMKLGHLSEQDQFKVQALIRKSLVTKIGSKDPTIVANENK
jgi:hypothetical protein